MADNSKPGIKAELARQVGSVAAHASARENPADQMALFEANVEAHMPLPAAAGASGPKGGRPVGSQNVRTRVVADYYLNRYGDPLEAMFRLAMRPIGELVTDLQAVAERTGVRLLGKNQSLKDLLSLQMQALDAALPYVRQRMPLAVDVETTKRDVLIVGVVTPEQRAQAAAFGLDLSQARDPAKSLESLTLDASAADASPLDATPVDIYGVDMSGENDGQAHD